MSGSFKFRLVVRKRPLLPREVKDGELDIISNSENSIRVHECKTKVDGITKYIQTSDFAADRVIGHKTQTEAMYQKVVMKSLEGLVSNTRQAGKDNILTCFAFG